MALAIAINPVIDLVITSTVVVQDGAKGLFGAPGLVSSSAVGAIAIVSPVLLFTSSILLAIVSGAAARFNEALGRGNREEAAFTFRLAFTGILLLGSIFSAVTFFFPTPIVRLLGAKHDPALAFYASRYLKYAGLTAPFTGLAGLYINTLGINGHFRACLFANIVNIILNCIFSIVFYAFFAYEGPKMCMGALGLGTAASAFVSLLILIIAKRVFRINISVRFTLAFERAPHHAELTFAHDLAYCASGILFSVISGFINNMILTLFHGTKDSPLSGAMVLSLYSVVSSIWGLACVPGDALCSVTNPLVGLFYGSEDRASLKNLFKTEMNYGVIHTAIWFLILLFLTPVLSVLYGENTAYELDMIHSAVMITIPFSLAYSIRVLLEEFYDLTDHLFMYLLVSVVPSCAVFPLMLFLLMRLTPMGEKAIWLSLGGSELLFLLGLYLFFAIKKKKFPVPLEDFTLLSSGKSGRHPMFDDTLRTRKSDIGKMTEKIHSFLNSQKLSRKTCYFVTLCIDELLNDFLLNGKELNIREKRTSLLNVKIISEEDSVRVIIRNAAKPYNPLIMEKNTGDYSKLGIEMIQRLADTISYAYLFKMNIIIFSIKKEL